MPAQNFPVGPLPRKFHTKSRPSLTSFPQARLPLLYLRVMRAAYLELLQFPVTTR